jgi:hypothetical protein
MTQGEQDAVVVVGVDRVQRHPDSAGGCRLRADSPALGNGGVVADDGGRDYWGNPVPATAKPHRGAYHGPGP